MDTSGQSDCDITLTFDLQLGVLSRTYVQKLDHHLDLSFPGRFSAVWPEDVGVPQHGRRGQDDVTPGLYCVTSLKHS